VTARQDHPGLASSDPPPTARDGVHFWTLEDLDGILEWNPDSDPERHASGAGHALLGLFARLMRRGWKVTIGSRIPRESRLVVVYLEELADWHRLALVPWKALRLASAVRPHQSVLVIRNDTPLAIRVPAFVGCEVMPSRETVRHPGQVWLPLLPQGGLVPRDPGRSGRIERVVLKCHRDNVPEFVLQRDFGEELAAMGVSLVVDTKPADWPDFSACDVVLCARKRHAVFDQEDGSFERKPATKLTNAWVAGCIPIVMPERSYLDLARPGSDSLLAGSATAILDTIRRLRGDRSLAEHILAGSRARGEEFGQERVLGLWEDQLRAEHPRAGLLRLASARILWLQRTVWSRWSRSWGAGPA
jgi:hypothetical protein